jgi:hypothetical protein
MKNGKLPVAARKDYVTPTEAFGGGELELQPEVAAYLKKAGLGHKWLSVRHLKMNGGRHKRSWTIFNAKDAGLSIPHNPYGSSPDGTITVGDLVLGVKPLKGPGVTVESHKKILRQLVEDKTKQAMGSGQGGISIIEDDNE